MCVCVCVCARARVCACVCVCVRACGCARILNITHVFAGVCQWKKPGMTRECESEICIFLRIYILLF